MKNLEDIRLDNWKESDWLIFEKQTINKIIQKRVNKLNGIIGVLLFFDFWVIIFALLVVEGLSR